MSSLSIYFYAGDFVEAFRRHAAGEEQTYATHNEVAQLILDLVNAGVAVRIYSFITPFRGCLHMVQTQPLTNTVVVDLSP